MYKHIYVPVDNSDYSNRAIELAVELGTALGTRLTGSHVYAARLHDYRFKQMEYTLPEEYKDENELERQRKIHDSLIAMGLQLISESYLDVLKTKAEAAGLPFNAKMMDGKHYKALIEDTLASDYDLVIMGALGMGAVKDSQLGSVTERFVRKNFGQMDIEITIDDPKAYTKPWSVTQQLAFQADTELLEYICNENNKYFDIIPKLPVSEGGSQRQ